MKYQWRVAALLVTTCGISISICLSQEGPSPEERAADLEARLRTASAVEQPALLNQLAILVRRQTPQRTIELTARALELIGDHPDASTGPEAALAHKTRARARLDLEEYEEALADLEAAEHLFAEAGNTTEQAKCLGYQGIVLGDMGRLWPAIEAGRRTLELFRQLDDPVGIAAITNNLGTYLTRVGEYEEALELILESMTLQRKLGNTLGVANALTSAGNVHAELGNKDRARESYQEALDLFTGLGDQYGIIQCLTNLGNSAREDGDDELALEQYRKALGIARELKMPSQESNLLNNMGNAYARQGHTEQALECHQKVLEIRTGLGNLAGLAVSHSNIADTYLRAHRPAEALEHLNQAHAIATSSEAVGGPADSLLDSIYFNRAEAYHQLGDDSSAYEDLARYAEVRDSLLNEEKTRAIAEMQARFDATRRREQIELLTKDNELLTKEQKIHALELGRTRLVAALLALLVGLAVVLAILLLRRYRSLLAFWKKRVFIGPYRVEREISQGGMGVVYEATSLTVPGRTVALKVIRQELARDAVQRRRFLNEGRIIDGLDHPGIVKVYERGESDERLYIAMELVDGQPLGQLIAEGAATGTPIPLAACREIMLQLTDALGLVHAHGIVHRDIKPMNIVITSNGDVRPRATLLDFGLARLDTMTTLTQAGELLGTVSYLAPECIRHSEPTPASDVFSLGVVLYEMLTLERPFLAEEPVDLLRMLLETEPLDPRSYRPEISEDLGRLVLAMLAKQPGSRPDDEALLHQLTRLTWQAAPGTAGAA